MSVIEIEHLYKSFRIPHEKSITLFETITGIFKPASYETLDALKNINFSVEEGEAIGIIGENGSGKSTLLKVIAHILNPTEGSVKINKKITPFLELGVGFHPEMTAIENIKTYGTIMGMSKKDIRSKTDEILDFAGLEKFRDTKLRNFSSGMQVRLAFSTAIQTDPEILLLDEVLAVGDMEFQQKCLDVLNTYRKKGVTIVFVSHDLGAVRRFCDRALFLHKGEQIAIGQTGEVIDKYVYGPKVDSKITIQNQDTVLVSADTSIKNNSRKYNNAEIVDVKFYDKFGHENNRFNSSDMMTVRIFYNSPGVFKDPVFGIVLYSDSGEHLFGTNTYLRGYDIEQISGNGYIDFIIEKVPMLSGTFLLTVDLVYSKNYVFVDHKDKEFSFTVISTGIDEGIFGISSRWELV